MSWSVSATGTIEGVKKALEKQFESAANTYAGKPEGDDIVAVKTRVFALIDALDLTDGYWNGASVSARGSHSSSGKGLQNANGEFSVARTAIAL